MAIAAIEALRARGGSSVVAITKHIKASNRSRNTMTLSRQTETRRRNGWEKLTYSPKTAIVVLSALLVHGHTDALQQER